MLTRSRARVPVLPEKNFCDSCDYHEVAIAFFDKANDSLFNDNEDFFYFYALGPDDWTNVYDPSQPDTPPRSTIVDHLCLAIASITAPNASRARRAPRCCRHSPFDGSPHN